MSHVNPFGSTTDEARPPGWPVASYERPVVVSEFVQPPGRTEPGRARADDDDARISADFGQRQRRNPSICEIPCAEFQELQPPNRNFAGLALLVHDVDFHDVVAAPWQNRQEQRRRKRSGGTQRAARSRSTFPVVCTARWRRGSAPRTRCTAPRTTFVRYNAVPDRDGVGEHRTRRHVLPELAPCLVKSSSGIWRSLSMRKTYSPRPHRAPPSTRLRAPCSADGPHGFGVLRPSRIEQGPVLSREPSFTTTSSAPGTERGRHVVRPSMASRSRPARCRPA